MVAGVRFELTTFGLCDLTQLSLRVGLYLHPVKQDARHVRLPALPSDEHLQDGFQGDLSFSRAGFTVLELDPAFVEAFQHSNTGCGILHALRSE